MLYDFRGGNLLSTYTRDSYTGLDYADQRMYASTYGRFNTPDPYRAGGASSGNSSNPSDPGSWNRYAYVGGDPINRVDPKGTDWIYDFGSGGWCSTLDFDGGCYDPESDPCYDLAPLAWMNYGGFEQTCGSGISSTAVYYQPPQEQSGGSGTATAPPSCASTYGVPNSVELPQLAVLLGENSWGLYPNSAVANEDLYMEQAMYNYAAPKGFASSSATVDSTVNTDTYRGYSNGAGVLAIDLTSAATSAFCQDLTTAENAYTTFWDGSHSFSNVNQWRTATGSVGAGQTQIAGTVFFYNPSAFYSPTRPVRRPTPPIKLPGITGR